MSMDPTMANAFAAGSGIDPATMRTAILSVAAAVLLLIAAWIVNKLFNDYLDERISHGELLNATLKLAAVVMALLLFLGWYR